MYTSFTLSYYTKLGDIVPVKSHRVSNKTCNASHGRLVKAIPKQWRLCCCPSCLPDLEVTLYYFRKTIIITTSNTRLKELRKTPPKTPLS